MRRKRVSAKASARKKSCDRPAPPWIWIALSMIAPTAVGTTILAIAISLRAALLPAWSITHAAFSVISRACSSSQRDWPIAWRTAPISASVEPKAERSLARLHIASMARSPSPMKRMQWWMRPGPSLPWAISKPRPSPSSMLAAGTRTLSKTTSAWPSGGCS